MVALPSMNSPFVGDILKIVARPSAIFRRGAGLILRRPDPRRERPDERAVGARRDFDMDDERCRLLHFLEMHFLLHFLSSPRFSSASEHHSKSTFAKFVAQKSVSKKSLASGIAVVANRANATSYAKIARRCPATICVMAWEANAFDCALRWKSNL